MSYSENVAALAKRYGLQNPLLEESLAIESMTFRDDFDNSVVIIGSDMNRAGRFFIEHLYSERVMEDQATGKSQWNQRCKDAAADFFGNNWRDAWAKGRQMLIAMHFATSVDITWKP